jgi:hypothetical protein
LYGEIVSSRLSSTLLAWLINNELLDPYNPLGASPGRVYFPTTDEAGSRRLRCRIRHAAARTKHLTKRNCYGAFDTVGKFFLKKIELWNFPPLKLTH